MAKKKEYIFKAWEEKLDKFSNSVDSALDKVHECKAEMQQIKEEMYNHIFSGCYMRDDGSIVISAPKIIIGNVDKSGEICGPSEVIIRSNNIALQGVGNTGKVETRANTIANIASDPGSDGREAVVHANSTFSCLAKNIALDSCKANGAFPRYTASGTLGLSLHSDTEINIDASIGNKTLKKDLKTQIEALKSSITALETEVSSRQTSLNTYMASMEEILDKNSVLANSDKLCDTNVAAVDTLVISMTEASKGLFVRIDKYLKCLSELAEAKRAKRELEEMNSSVATEEEYKEATKAKVMVNAEKIHFTTKDGDGVVRTNDESGLRVVRVKNVEVLSKNRNGSLLDGARVQVEAQYVNFFTNVSKKEKGKDATLDKADGEIRMNSKNIIITANDYEAPKQEGGDGGDNAKKDTDSLYPVSAVAKDGKITIGAETIGISSADKDGKAAGKVGINSKEITLQSANVAKKDGDNKEANNDNNKVELAEGGATRIFSETVSIGGDEKKSCQGKRVEVCSATTFVDSETGIMLSQGKDDKNFVTMMGNKLMAKSESGQIFEANKHSYSGEVNIANEAKVKKITAGEVVVESHFKAPQHDDTGTGHIDVPKEKTEKLEQKKE